MADLRGECVCHPRRLAPLNAAIAQEEFDRERRVTLRSPSNARILYVVGVLAGLVALVGYLRQAEMAQALAARTLARALGIASSWVPFPEWFGPMMQPATVLDMTTERTFARTGPQSSSQ